MYYSTKIVDGFSVCFRQWRATTSHCSYLHGYALKFKITFKSENLDHNNWVKDFGFLSKDKELISGKNFKQWFNYMFDHTTIIAKDDPEKETFRAINQEIINLRIIDDVGCEKFAEYVFKHLELTLNNETTKVHSVECIENDKNSAIYER